MDTGAQLLAAARCGDADDVRSLSAVAGAVDYQDEYTGNTALHMACANGHLASVQILMNSGAKHIPNASGNTPLRKLRELCECEYCT